MQITISASLMIASAIARPRAEGGIAAATTPIEAARPHMQATSGQLHILLVRGMRSGRRDDSGVELCCGAIRGVLNHTRYSTTNRATTLTPRKVEFVNPMNCAELSVTMVPAAAIAMDRINGTVLREVLGTSICAS